MSVFSEVTEGANSKETIDLLDEGQEIFDKETVSDLNLVDKIYQGHDEIKQFCESKETDTKALIRALIGGVEELKQQASGAAGGKLNAKIGGLVTEREQTQHRIASIKRDIEGLEKNAELARTSAEHRLVDTKHTVKHLEENLRSLEVKLAFYKKITHITWDSEAPKGEVKGTAHLVAKREMVPFAYLDTSPVEVADKLWELMGVDYL